MKFMRHMALFLSAVFMSLAMAVPVIAAETSITIHPSTQSGVGPNDRFQGYQIFVGTIMENNDHQVAKISWGNGIDSDMIVEEMQSDEVMGEAFSEYYAAWLEQEDQMTEPEMTAHFLDENQDMADAFSRLVSAHLIEGAAIPSVRDAESGDWMIEADADGYYLVVDTYESALEEHKYGAVSAYILEVAGSTDVTLKASLPTVTKTVGEGQKAYLSESGEMRKYPFTLIGTLPENFEYYDTYTYIFHDTINRALTVDGSSIHVTVDDWELSRENGDYEAELSEEAGADNTLKITFSDLRDQSVYGDVTHESEIKVVYDAYINEYAQEADIQNGFPNDVYLEYSNNPYKEGMGETPEDEVKSYTLALNIVKKDGSAGEDAVLPDAEFVLKNGKGEFARMITTEDDDGVVCHLDEWVSDIGEASKMRTSSEGTLSIVGLANGTYTLDETQAPDGYDEMEDIIFDVKATLSETGTLDTVDASLNAENRKREDASFSAQDNGVINATLINYKAAILPHTGGGGTMIFYVFGALAVLGGGAFLLLSKKKKS